MNRSVLKETHVWITGASSGIGLEMSQLAAEAGAHLTLLSSRKDKLADAASLCAAAGAASVRYEAIDLSNAEKATQVASSMLKGMPAPDYLILNAGVSQRARAADTTLDTARKIMDLNFFGAVAVFQTVLPAMVEAGGGRIGITSSLTGVFGGPLRSSYSASKHALKGYFESVALEYFREGIRVTIAVPGFIRTKIGDHALTADGKEYGRMDENQEKGMDPRQCAVKYWRGVLRGRSEQVIEGKGRFYVFLYRHLRFLFLFLGTRISATGNDD